MGAQNVDVLIDRIGSALVPLATGALRGGKNFHELVEFTIEPGPAVYQVTDQRMRLVLGEYANASYTRVDAVR